MICVIIVQDKIFATRDILLCTSRYKISLSLCCFVANVGFHVLMPSNADVVQCLQFAYQQWHIQRKFTIIF